MKKKTYKKNQSKTKKKEKLLKRTIVFIVLDIIAIICFFIMYGPWNYIRNLYVTTAMNTMEHRWMARIFYSEKKIEKIMNGNYFVTINEDANLDDIVINTKEKKKYKNEYEKELLTRDEGNDLYKVIRLKVGSADAHLVAIYNPKKVELIHTKKFNVGGYGERVMTMCERYNGVVCINGGGFVDNGMGSDIPVGYVIKDHEIIWTPKGENENTYRDNIIGITDDGKLKLMANATGEEAINANIKDIKVSGNIINTGNTGGIAGYAGNCNIINCYNYININSNGSTGGIIGLESGDGKIVNCYNYGNVSGKPYGVGGIIGYNIGHGETIKILNSGNSGIVENKGGIS